MARKLEERSFEVQNIINNQLYMINQLVIVNHKENKKDLEITNLRLQNEKLKSELRHEKELMERLSKPNEEIKHFEKMLRSPRMKDTSRIGYNKHSSSRRRIIQKWRTKECKNQRKTYMSLLWENWSHTQ